MALHTTTAAPKQFLGRALPPLENGDHLTRAEFERRYEAMPHLKKAELIEAVVYVPSPVRHRWRRRLPQRKNCIALMARAMR